MAKTEGTAGERAELYRFIAEEAERRHISNKSVCEEREVSYNAFSVFRSRQHRKDNDGIAVKRIVPEPETAPEQDKIEISATTQCKRRPSASEAIVQWKRYERLSRMYRHVSN